MPILRNRIIDHRYVKARDLIPHELNPRTHSKDQRDALDAIYREVGYARSSLAYELPDGRLKLIDGHLRLSQCDPDDDVLVEVLDVTDAEARKLLLTIDPLASLAAYSDDHLQTFRDITRTDEALLNALWSGLAQADAPRLTPPEEPSAQPQVVTTQWLCIIECADEREQARAINVCQTNGFKAKAVSS